ncbi:hypothetical protein GCM10010517_06070 [Streptosporangium fragile]|uniref:Uncharacterized protein n=1 Tax=Streptosporangium fragile TaxID=46186 RepID=A0ABN3VQ35_9ACTN
MAGHVGVEDLGDVLAAHPPHRLHLTRKTATGDVVTCHLGAEDLDRHLPALRVDGEVNHAHTALTEPPEQPVRAQSVILIHGMKHHIGLDTAREMNRQATFPD